MARPDGDHVPCGACSTEVPHVEAHLIASDSVYLCDACFGEMDERGMGRPAAELARAAASAP